MQLPRWPAIALFFLRRRRVPPILDAHLQRRLAFIESRSRRATILGMFLLLLSGAGLAGVLVSESFMSPYLAGGSVNRLIQQITPLIIRYDNLNSSEQIAIRAALQSVRNLERRIETIDKSAHNGENRSILIGIIGSPDYAFSLESWPLIRHSYSYSPTHLSQEFAFERPQLSGSGSIENVLVPLGRIHTPLSAIDQTKELSAEALKAISEEDARRIIQALKAELYSAEISLNETLQLVVPEAQESIIKDIENTIRGSTKPEEYYYMIALFRVTISAALLSVFVAGLRIVLRESRQASARAEMHLAYSYAASPQIVAATEHIERFSRLSTALRRSDKNSDPSQDETLPAIAITSGLQEAAGHVRDISLGALERTAGALTARMGGRQDATSSPQATEKT